MAFALRYRLIDLARGTDCVGLLTKMRRWQYECPDTLAASEAADLVSYFHQLRQAVPLFQNVKRFADLPVLNKSFINAHRAALMNPHYRGRKFRKKTGGSTGEPLVYYTGAESQSHLWAGLFLAWEAAGYRLGEPVAFLSGSSLYGNGYKQRVYYRLLKIGLMSAFDLSPHRMTMYGTALREGHYRLLYGYASAIHRLARHYLESGKRLDTRLRAVICTAEMLTPAMRADIESAFGVPCFNQYGCHDAGISAFECEQRNGWHLISTRCHAEIISGGRLISTDLANRVMFMPRYDTGDLVQMSGRRCNCGRSLPLIDAVLGRQNDVVVDAEGGAVHSEFFTHLFREDARIRTFQVVFDDRELMINLHCGGINQGEQVTLSQHYRPLLAATLGFAQLKLVFDQPFLMQANGKHRFVLRRP